MRKYLTNTFSPMMLGEGTQATVKNCSLGEVKEVLPSLASAVSHEVTAKILETLLGEEIGFNRVNINLKPGDEVFCVIPGFRTSEAREFTFGEVSSAGFRCVKIVTREALPCDDPVIAEASGDCEFCPKGRAQNCKG